MKVLIFEDEKHTANHLISLLQQLDANIEIQAVIGSVREGLAWFKQDIAVDLIFQDIILSDGNCFELYEQHSPSSPIIFTTAFSEYALQSFKLNSIDYIVKPYDIKDIKAALDKFNRFQGMFKMPEQALLSEIIHAKKQTAKRRFLIKTGDHYHYINSKDIAYLISEDSLTFAKLFNKQRFIVDYSISELSQVMDQENFFQINRKLIVNIQSVQKISTWFNGRLKVEIQPAIADDVMVSRDRVKAFKLWLDQ